MGGDQQQGKFEQGDKTSGQGKPADEQLFVRVQAEGGGKGGPFSAGPSRAISDLLSKLEIQQTGETPRTRPDAQQEAQPEARTRPDVQQAQAGGERDVAGPNGSKIHLSSKFPDGQERVAEITEPDGLRHAYRWQEVNGKIVCTATADISPQGQMIAGSALQRDMKTWNVKAGNATIPIQGTLTIDNDGTHRFREGNGNTFTRRPDGSATYSDSSGQNLPHPLARGPKQANTGMRPKK
jgi:hypothetical protein